MTLAIYCAGGLGKETIELARIVNRWEKIVFIDDVMDAKGSSLIWLDDSILFSGDNLVNGTGVICRFPGGSKREYTDITRPILEKVLDGTMVLPGHGDPGRLGELRIYLDFFRKKKLLTTGEKLT